MSTLGKWLILLRCSDLPLLAVLTQTVLSAGLLELLLHRPHSS